LKILQVAPYFIPYPGGQEKYVFNLSKFLTKRGHEVHVLTSNYPKGKKLEEYEGITIERYDVFARPLRNPLALGFLKIGKKFKEFDIVHTHNEHSFSAMVAAYFKRKYNIPLVLTCHGQLVFGDKFADTFESFYSKTIGKSVFKTADLIIALSQPDKEYIISLINEPKKIKILPNAIDLEELYNLSPNKKIVQLVREKYGIAGKKVVLFTGQIIRRKGIEYLIKAIPLVVNKLGDDVRFILTGKGDYMKEAKTLSLRLAISENVIFPGLVNFIELLALYQLSDVFVLPSLSEGLSTSVLEAMHFGLPIVATDILGMRSHFGDVATLIPPRDEKALSEAILDIIKGKKLEKDYFRIQKQMIKDTYNWDFVAKEYEECYRNLRPTVFGV